MSKTDMVLAFMEFSFQWKRLIKVIKLCVTNGMQEKYRWFEVAAQEERILLD